MGSASKIKPSELLATLNPINKQHFPKPHSTPRTNKRSHFSPFNCYCPHFLPILSGAHQGSYQNSFVLLLSEELIRNFFLLNSGLLYFPHLLPLREHHADILRIPAPNRQQFLSFPADTDPCFYYAQTGYCPTECTLETSSNHLVATTCFLVKELVAFQVIPCSTQDPQFPFAKQSFHLRYPGRSSNAPIIEAQVFYFFLIKLQDFRQSSIP